MKITIDLDGLNLSELCALSRELRDTFYGFEGRCSLGCDGCDSYRVCRTLRIIAAQVRNAYEDACEGVQA